MTHVEAPPGPSPDPALPPPPDDRPVEVLDVAGLEDLVRVAGPRLLRTAILLVGESQAPDLVQVALAVVWTRRASLSGPEAAEAFARGVMARQATAWWRRRWTGESPTETLPERPVDDPDTAQAVAVRAALAKLSRRERAVLVLRHLDDLSEEATAAALGCSVDSVKNAARRGLARLREQSWEGIRA